MSSRREAHLYLPASQRDGSRPTAMQTFAALLHQLAAQHGVALTTDTELLEWLTQANVPSGLDSSACTAIASVVQQLYALAAPGGGDDGVR